MVAIGPGINAGAGPGGAGYPSQAASNNPLLRN